MTRSSTSSPRHLRAKQSPMSQLLLFPLSGAYGDVADGDTAFGGSRSATYAVVVDGLAPNAELLGPERQWVRSTWDAVRPFAPGAGGYVNLMSEYGDDRVRATYGSAKYERLARIKAVVRPGQRPALQRQHQTRLTSAPLPNGWSRRGGTTRSHRAAR